MKPAKKKVLLFVAFFASLLAISVIIADHLTEATAHINPPYAQIDLVPILDQKEFAQDDYQTLFYQTGLGKTAIDELKANSPDFEERVLYFQDLFFTDVSVTSQNNTFVSKEEYTTDKNGNISPLFEFALIKDNYILVTKSSITLGWRNGHSAIIVNQDKGQTLESVVLGTNSRIQDISKWTYYPNVIVLKLKGNPDIESGKIAKYALQHLNDIPYRLSIGVFSAKEQTFATTIKGTQCAHLVWQAYAYFGYDLDSNGGKIVTPKDIANSSLLEVVQVFGVDPRQIWP